MGNNKRLKIITAPILIISLVSLFTDIASEMLYPISPIFLTSYLGASMAVLGLVEGIAEAVSGLSKGYFGILSEKSWICYRNSGCFIKSGIYFCKFFCRNNLDFI